MDSHILDCTLCFYSPKACSLGTFCEIEFEGDVSKITKKMTIVRVEMDSYKCKRIGIHSIAKVDESHGQMIPKPSIFITHTHDRLWSTYDR
ncbi:hypothetical protein SUGI_0812830 [Cryptomeria japonica]|nr:hypothetical protein SUGI_0812830 [Cryptomeria japonica]